MIRKILIVHEPSHTSSSHFAKAMGSSFKQVGLEITFLSDPKAVLRSIELNHPDIVLSFAKLEEKLPCALVYYFFDSAEYYFDETRGPNIYFAVRDGFSLKMIKSMGEPKSFLLLNGVEQSQNSPIVNSRPYPVSYFGNAYFPSDNLTSKLSESVNQAIDRAVELNFLNPYQSYHESLIYALKLDRSIKREDVEKLDTPTLLQHLSKKIETDNVLKVVESLHHTPIHLFGLGWDRLISQENVTFHESVSFEKKLDIMGQTQIVLSANMNMKYGLHENVLYPYLMGSLSLTNYSPLIENEFSINESILVYYPSHLNNIEKEITPLLEKEALREKMVLKGREIIQKHHSWDLRVEEFLSQMNHLIK